MRRTPRRVTTAMGVPYAAFEALTLGTLAFIIAIALVGYLAGRPLRVPTGAAGTTTEHQDAAS